MSKKITLAEWKARAELAEAQIKEIQQLMRRRCIAANEEVQAATNRRTLLNAFAVELDDTIRTTRT